MASLFQFVLATKLSWFRRIFTPTVAGTVLMLISGNHRTARSGPADRCAGRRIAAGRARDGWCDAGSRGGDDTRRLRRVAAVGPVIGMGLGSAVGGLMFGIYDTTRILEADWLGLPVVAWPGLDLSFGPAFWALLPAFVMVTLIGALDTIGDSIAVQRASWRRPRAIDFRSVQGALTADGLGNLLSGFAGTVPNTTYAMGIAVTEMTRVAARSVGVCVGVLFVVLAFLPKCVAVVVAIPSQVVAAYFIMLMAILFIMGMRILFQDGLDYRRASLWASRSGSESRFSLTGFSRSIFRERGVNCSETG